LTALNIINFLINARAIKLCKKECAKYIGGRLHFDLLAVSGGKSVKFLIDL
jgi:hypothetical protein